jgi:hypothetical protein
MSALNFRDREPDLDQARKSDSQFLTGNRAIYERLQGQGRKSVIARFGWIAVPVAVVAVIGVAAVTSLPQPSADHVGGPPGQASASATQ